MEYIRWAYEAPDKHQHAVSGWSFVDDEISGEIVLTCSRCGATWHTGRPADDNFHQPVILKVAAACWLHDERLGKVNRRQLVLPLDIPDTVLRAPLVRRNYTPAPRVDTSAQLPLFAVAA